MELFYRQRYGGDLLHEFGADERRDPAAAGSGDEGTAVVPADVELRFEPPQKFQRFLGLFGFMALVVGPDDLVRGPIHDHGFHGGRSDVDAGEQSGAHGYDARAQRWRKRVR